MRPDIAAITERLQVKLQIAIEHHHDMTRCEDEQALLAYIAEVELALRASESAVESLAGRIAELEEELAQARNAAAQAH